MLSWHFVEERLVAAANYWIATVGSAGAPHVRPVDGVWVDSALCFGGSPKTQWVRNLQRDARLSAHVPDDDEVIILEGRGELVTDDAHPLAAPVGSGDPSEVPAVLHRGTRTVVPSVLVAATEHGVRLDAQRFSPERDALALRVNVADASTNPTDRSKIASTSGAPSKKWSAPGTMSSSTVHPGAAKVLGETDALVARHPRVGLAVLEKERRGSRMDEVDRAGERRHVPPFADRAAKEVRFEGVRGRLVECREVGDRIPADDAGERQGVRTEGDQRSELATGGGAPQVCPTRIDAELFAVLPQPADCFDHVVTLGREDRLAAEPVVRRGDHETGIGEALEEPPSPAPGLPRSTAAMALPPPSTMDVHDERTGSLERSRSGDRGRAREPR